MQGFVLCAPQSVFNQYRVANPCSALCLVHFLYVCEDLQVGTRAPWAVPWGLTPCLPGSLASYNMLDSYTRRVLTSVAYNGLEGFVAAISKLTMFQYASPMYIHLNI